MVFPILPANTLSGGYDIENSYRFNAADEHNFARTPSSSGNRKTWTFSCWIKRASLSGSNYPRLLTTEGSDSISLNFMQEDTLRFQAASNHLITNMVFRDLSAWYHIVLAMDSAQGTAANRTKLYVNGTQVTSFGTANYVSQNEERAVMHTVNHELGRYADNEDNAFDGYMSEVAFVDGTAYAASDFGETDEDSGIWKPKKLDVTWGTNGAFLEFKQTGTSANASGMGADTSGNGNHWTPENLAAVDQCTDTPTNNFATLNSVHWTADETTLSEGNTKLVINNEHNIVPATIATANGKWYVEMKAKDGSSGNKWVPALMNVDFEYSKIAGTNWLPGSSSSQSADDTIGMYRNDVIKNDGTVQQDEMYAGNIADGEIIGMAIDCDNGKIWYSKDGYWNNDDPQDGAIGGRQSTTLNASYHDATFTTTNTMVIAAAGETCGWEMNFGNPPFSISSGNADANGYGNFEYAVPSGYYALCTKNLAEYG